MYSQLAVGLVLQDNVIVFLVRSSLPVIEKSPTKDRRDRAIRHRLTACDVVPTGSWAMSCDHSTKVWLGHQVLGDVV